MTAVTVGWLKFCAGGEMRERVYSGPRCLLFGRLACAWKRCCVVSSNGRGRKISLGGDGELYEAHKRMLDWVVVYSVGSTALKLHNIRARQYQFQG